MFNATDRHYVFSELDLGQVITAQEAAMLKEVDAIPANQLLNSSIEDLADYFARKYRLDVPALSDDGVSADQHDVDVDVSQDQNRWIRDRSHPFHIRGTRITYFVPYQGDADLFKCQPSTFYTDGAPAAAVRDGELVLTYERTDHDAAAFKSAFDRDLARVRQYLEWIARDCAGFNAAVRDKAKARIEIRREKFLKDQGLVASLGVPLRRRPDAPQTYVVPTVRRSSPISMPAPSAAPYVPEPTLAMAEYEHILGVVSNMVAVMERSPQAFVGMEEEHLRQHFLVQLNGQYEGQATGETFNFEGKTDILIRFNGRNIFVAECKFWRGPEKLREALDQLLGYATWRDSKLAVLIFSRTKRFTDTLAKIPEVVQAHPNCKRSLPYASETGFRYVFSHRDDPNRELIVTALAFDVPA